jgi:hypothetical protein
MNYDSQYLVYTKRPFYISQLIRKSNATPVAKLAYERLLDYALFKNTTMFSYENAWLAKEINVSPRTIARAKENLVELGFMTRDGEIIVSEPESPEVRESKFANQTTNQILEQSIKAQKISSTQALTHVVSQKVLSTPTSTTEAERDAFYTAQVAVYMSMNFIASEAKKIALIATNAKFPTEIDATKCPLDVTDSGQNVTLEVTKCRVTGDKMSPIYNSPTITVKQITDLPLPKPAAKTSLAEKPKTEKGLFSNSAHRGTVREKELIVQVAGNRKSGVARSIGEIVSQAGEGSKVFTSIPYRTTAYIEAGLRRMGAHGLDAERYSDEIKFSMTKGNFSQTEPLKAARACLKIIERGAWRAPAGMY